MHGIESRFVTVPSNILFVTVPSNVLFVTVPSNILLCKRVCVHFFRLEILRIRTRMRTRLTHVKCISTENTKHVLFKGETRKTIHEHSDHGGAAKGLMP